MGIMVYYRSGKVTGFDTSSGNRGEGPGALYLGYDDHGDPEQEPPLPPSARFLVLDANRNTLWRLRVQDDGSGGLDIVVDPAATDPADDPTTVRRSLRAAIIAHRDAKVASGSTDIGGILFGTSPADQAWWDGQLARAQGLVNLPATLVARGVNGSGRVALTTEAEVRSYATAVADAARAESNAADAAMTQVETACAIPDVVAARAAADTYLNT